MYVIISGHYWLNATDQLEFQCKDYWFVTLKLTDDFMVSIGLLSKPISPFKRCKPPQIHAISAHPMQANDALFCVAKSCASSSRFLCRQEMTPSAPSCRRYIWATSV